MSKVKERIYKKKLSKAAGQSRRIPAFVIAKTKRKVSYNSKARNWRRQKLGLKK